jgi:hypothetical protein
MTLRNAHLLKLPTVTNKESTNEPPLLFLSQLIDNQVLVLF